MSRDRARSRGPGAGAAGRGGRARPAAHLLRRASLRSKPGAGTPRAGLIRGVLFTALLLSSPPAAAQERMAGYVREEYSCIMCHADKRRSFLQGLHAERGIVCVDCHGGNPKSFDREGAHARAAGYRGKTDKPAAVRLCLSCHGDMARMRQFGLPAVTREEFLLSRHGRRLLVDGDTAAPSCGDCHGSHATFPPEDARSPVNPMRVAETCAACHSDPQRMPRGMPTDQLEQWRTSAHGVELLDRHNAKAATCSSCHGSHTALPPGVAEIANVCGKCHRLEREAFFRGPHGPAAGRARSALSCIACHSAHGTEAPAAGQIQSLCARCHASGSAPDIAALQLQEQLAAAALARDEAVAAIDALVRAGAVSRDQEARLRTLDTALGELRVEIHSLDGEAVAELVRRARSLSTEIRGRAEIVAEARWERKLLVIPLWLGVLGGVALAVRKRRQLARRPVDEKVGAPPADMGAGEGGGP